MLDARQYATGTNALTTLNLTTPAEVSKNYTISVTADNAATPPSYTITAAPTGAQQANDTTCGTIGLDQTGLKGKIVGGVLTAASECW